ncbi:hypothetical protein CIHG_08316 [Coccidioides immitis H538.4]|uniref:Uncharacterized protein n=2 Tax=Coccidioides immitis TaxID=5501 RepID=A0A0J8RZI8_COCIT|nr:hypothetical protein CIRG_02273 [Coccidioides immitis RMSCC 2394]KMU90600.1 hypothetical protein CIHG_08316 [Coccidioides immitis H538.4]
MPVRTVADPASTASRFTNRPPPSCLFFSKLATSRSKSHQKQMWSGWKSACFVNGRAQGSTRRTALAHFLVLFLSYAKYSSKLTSHVVIWATYNPEWLAAVAAAEPGTEERLAERRIAPRSERSKSHAESQHTRTVYLELLLIGLGLAAKN